ETKKVIIRLPLGSFRRFQLKSMNYSGLQHFFKNIKIIASSVGLLTKFFCTLLVTFFFIFRFR
ncbi:hypothetical protein, partial [Enterococcus faecalis]|uniref:hypothetical protein n=1 Tax=Enterococcus faecalis TaxID=1351 RepID=UPI00403FBA62